MATDGTGTDDKTALQQQGDVKDGGKDTQKQTNSGDAAKAAEALKATFGELETETSEWLTRREVKDVPSLVKLAFNNDKMVGDQAAKLGQAIIRPGKDAKPEEIEAFREKMGMGKTPDDYAFEMPKNLPENLPYDGERAKSFGSLAHKIELTKSQAQAVHDWAVENGVADFENAGKEHANRIAEQAKAATTELTKVYGPVDGQQFKTNAAFADKVLELGGERALEELKELGAIAEIDGKKYVQRPGLFELFAKIGSTLYKEDDVLRGDPTSLDNPFMDGEKENLTEQARMIKSDKPRALSLIAAAGKKPADFGLTV
jgi:hypothetical protein